MTHELSRHRLLFVGCDKGSWQMRGRQLGSALGAPQTSRPHTGSWSSADVIVLVKRAPHVWYREVKTSGAMLIWDVLDFWHQPSGNTRTEADLLKYVFEIRDGLHIAKLIGATQAMAKAIGGVYLPHHSRAGLQPTQIRERLKVVAYDGSARYLGSWRAALERACARLGLTFVVNPDDLRHVDLFVSFRGEEWDGWVCRQWKSGVKYVNAIAAGRPILSQSSAAFQEIQPPGGVVVEDPAGLEDAIRALAPADVRQAVLQQCLRRYHEFSLEKIARRYQKLISQWVLEPACV